MSLTRDEWEKIWISITYIELQVNRFIKAQPTRRLINKEIDDIKKQIESVIGQQEEWRQ